MKSSLRRLFGSQSDGKVKAPQQASYDPPYLPSPRPRTLTPSSSQDSLAKAATFAVSQSLFFQKLPNDLRRDILILAFGERVVHVHLTFSHPPVSTGRKEPALNHCEVPIIDTDNIPRWQSDAWRHGKVLKLDRGKPEAWRWWSCVCHAIPPGSRHLIKDGVIVPPSPWTDQCRLGEAQDCDLWPGTRPLKCFVGAMGWLLSCRQAYTEGIDVLYTTNTISMSHEFMISHLQWLFPKQRLATVTSLEISWSLLFSRQTANDQTLKLEGEHLSVLFEMIPTHLGGLRSLYLSLHSKKYVGDRLEAEGTLLLPVDDMIRRHPNLDRLSLALPVTVFDLLAKKKVENVKRERELQHWYPGQLWRSLNGEYSLNETHFSTYPQPPKMPNSENTVQGPGYWIVSGVSDGPEFPSW